jgi:hypothetical protein
MLREMSLYKLKYHVLFKDGRSMFKTGKIAATKQVKLTEKLKKRAYNGYLYSNNGLKLKKTILRKTQ